MFCNFFCKLAWFSFRWTLISWTPYLPSLYLHNKPLIYIDSLLKKNSILKTIYSYTYYFEIAINALIPTKIQSIIFHKINDSHSYATNNPQRPICHFLYKTWQYPSQLPFSMFSNRQSFH